MIKDFMLSFKDNVKDKTTNPFFGTLIIVWVFKNWKLLYTLFTIENYNSLDKRIEIINRYFNQESFWENIWWTICLTLLILVVSYILLNLSRLIINFFEKVITPKMYEWTDKSDIVLKKDYLALISENKRLKDKVEKERELRIKVQNERDELAVKLENDLAKSIFHGMDTSRDNSKPGSLADEELMVKKIDSDHYDLDFEKLITELAQDKLQSNKEYLNYFAKMGLIEVKSKFNNGIYYKLTELGERTKNAFIKSRIIDQ